MLPFWILIVCALAVAQDGPVLHTSTGKLHGYTKTADNGLQSEIYMSVPFARPPVGDLRFAKPQSYEDRDVNIDATHRPPACPQPEISLSPELYLNFSWYSEDCLFLNIFKPVTNASDLSIVIYIFGGSYLHGGANLFLWDGDVFASETNTIYVNFNYRLGIFGFLDAGMESASGNQGLWDTLEVIRWIKKNARAIGGNPNDITLWGQSAGAITVGAFMSSPKAQNLFNRAIMQSGATSTGTLLFKRNGPRIAQSAFIKLGCLNDTDDWESSKTIALDCAKRIDVESLLAKVNPKGFKLELLSWQPIIGDELIPEHPFNNKNQRLLSAKEVLMTTVSSEGTLFTEVLEKRAGGGIETLGDPRTVITVALRRIWDISIQEAKTLTNGYLDENSEPTGIALRQLVTNICGDMLFYCPIQYFTEAAERNHIKVYRGQFGPRPSYSPWPTYSLMGHADDVPLSSGKAIGLHVNYREARSFPPSRIINEITPEEVQWSLDTVRIFGDFVKNG